MTPTSESERREVAATLHEFADTDVWLSAMFAVLEKFGDTDRRSADAIADLIDPTCHVVTSGEWRGRPIGSACSVCHAPLYPSTAWTYGMRYCPQCGARVVEDAEGEDE